MKKNAKKTDPSKLPSKVSRLSVDESHTLQEWLLYAAEQIQVAEVNLENGMQEPYLEAEYLAHHALRLSLVASGRGSDRLEKPKKWQAHLRQQPPPNFPTVFADFLAQRIQQRLPVAYITGEAFFAGYTFAVNPQVLIPRSRIENLLDDSKALTRLLGTKRPKRILDLGTGSGCLAIAFALTFPQSMVDASDISVAALRVAAENRSYHKLEKRLQLIHSDLFANLDGRHYNLIVANPPYVCQASMIALPAEYRHEPALALDGGSDGLALVEPILRQAAEFLTPEGVLICEVGDETEEVFMERWPDLPVEWIYFHFGASGVFVARRADLLQWAQSTPMKSKNR